MAHGLKRYVQTAAGVIEVSTKFNYYYLLLLLLLSDYP